MTERSTPRARHRPTWTASLALVMLIGAACTSGDDDRTSSPTASHGTASGTTTPTAATASGSTSAVTSSTSVTATSASTAGADTAPAGTAGELDEADVAAITAAFQTFFGGITTTVDEKVAVLEDGETYRGMLTDASSNEQFQQMSTDIREVRPGSDTECAALDAAAGCAVVVHDLLVGEFPMAAALQSPAVEVDGRWLVGARAWCNIVEIGGASCPA